MKRRVVDTNVLIVANGRNTNASDGCREATIDGLKSIIDHARIIIDAAGEIIEEYRRHCFHAGQPGLGDEFFRLVLVNYQGKIERVDVPKNEDGSFVNFPIDARLNAFDYSDRKFAATAKASGARIVNSTDSDWIDHCYALTENGIEIEFLCGADRASWFK